MICFMLWKLLGCGVENGQANLERKKSQEEKPHLFKYLEEGVGLWRKACVKRWSGQSWNIFRNYRVCWWVQGVWGKRVKSSLSHIILGFDLSKWVDEREFHLLRWGWASDFKKCYLPPSSQTSSRPRVPLLGYRMSAESFKEVLPKLCDF